MKLHLFSKIFLVAMIGLFYQINAFAGNSPMGTSSTQDSRPSIPIPGLSSSPRPSDSPTFMEKFANTLKAINGEWIQPAKAALSGLFNSTSGSAKPTPAPTPSPSSGSDGRVGQFAIFGDATGVK